VNVKAFCFVVLAPLISAADCSCNLTRVVEGGLEHAKSHYPIYSSTDSSE